MKTLLALIVVMGGCSTNDGAGGVSLNDPNSPTAGKGGETGVDSGDTSAVSGRAVEYAVPSSGGSVMVVGKTGAQVSFTFPASASGRTVTFTPTSASEIGRSGVGFSEIIRMEPDGSQFADPIVVRPAGKNLFLLDFPSSPAKSLPEGLALNDSGDGLLLSHFSTLAIVPSDYSCVSSLGWRQIRTNAARAACTDPEFPNYWALSCQAYDYCLAVDAHCCAPEGATSCQLGYPSLALNYTPIESDGGETSTCTAPEEAPPEAAICEPTEAIECDCPAGSSGTQECLADGSNYNDCVCVADALPEPEPDAGPPAPAAICPQFNEDDCSVTDATACACSVSDSEHTYDILCETDNTSCVCQVDGAEIAVFERTEAVCESAQSVRAQWYAHCTAGTCP